MGKVHKNRTKEGPRTGVRTSGKTNSTPCQTNLHRTGPRGGEKTYKNRSQRARDLSLFFMSLGQHAVMPRGCISPAVNRPAAGDATEVFWRCYSLVCPEDYPLHSSGCYPPGGGSSVLNLLCAMGQANENCEHKSSI